MRRTCASISARCAARSATSTCGPELYTHYYRKEFPARFHDEMDTRRWGPGERIVFEPYTREVFEQSFKWIAEREIFDPAKMGAGRYEEACVSLTALSAACGRRSARAALLSPPAART